MLDPAVGESALLYAFLSESKRKGLHTGYVGIDIEQKAINVSKEIFSAENTTSSFIHCDALYPCQEMKSVYGWTELSKKYFPNGAIENAFLKFSRLNEDGKNFGGNIIISALVLKAPKIIQMNGNIIINEPIIKKK